ncbi:mothers against decapentaplegic homolog 6-like [Mugil cephalus]|uniref:mothers against decapentaplegic homolog 6-like n=1 Tax=Mugil cephalus TaxID=48193 RepID=UPI001FB7381E|nr:mothers against decapentaplegic homolog 6-like [Mugil cephalus]
MFKSKRSGLVRRLWRSRLVTESDGRDGSRRGEGGRNGQCGRHSGKLHSHEQRSVTHADPAPGLTGEAGDLTEGTEREEDEQPEDDRGGMCVPEHRSSRRGQESDSRTVTCCLFGEWDLRPRSPYWAPRKDGGGPCQCAPRRAGLEEELASTAHAFLKRLKERSLDALVKAVETKGGIPGECVMVPSSELRLCAHQISPQYLLCKLFRWSELPLTARLKALCHCQSFSAVDSAKVCCNPYHYSRLCGPESPPPPYSLSRSEVHKPLDSTMSYTETASPLLSSPPHIMPRDYTDTGTSIGSTASGGHRSHWCSVAYWEQRTRMGRLYPAYEPSLSIFYDLPQGTGLCLGQLHANAYHSRREDPGGHSTSGLHGRHSHGGNSSGSSSSSSSSSIQQIRSKIGFGIVLSREPDGVWVYNRSQHPVFVHSPTLDPPSARGLRVKRVMPGFSLKVFDYECSSWMAEQGLKPESQEGPWDPHSVRISFAKGWGPCYSRQFITSCPCWLEVLLNNHR